MSQHYLMEKPGEGQMYVPADKRSEYEQKGWTVIESPASSAPISAAPVDETPVVESEPKPTKKTAK